MSQIIRPATPEDIPQLVKLLLQDAKQRQAADGVLWKLAPDASAQIETALIAALTSEQQPFRQIWQVADEAGRISGVVHSMLLPVPPIYAGADGAPGLILPDSFAAPEACDGTVDALIAAAEAALRDAGARIILSSYVTGEDWRQALQRRGYAPLTLYLSRTGLDKAGPAAGVRPALETDVADIVRLSAENRQILFEIDPFWAPHPDADRRFAGWMRRSLTFDDRDMMVMGPPEELTGYTIAQPASRLHFPPAHDISGTGVLDDYVHRELANPAALANGGRGATLLLRAAEAAFAKRGIDAAFVVCPAHWQSKVEMLQAAGYETAMVWSIKR
ncbi:GNAT family N-acetyltransferase [Tritonibacter horizontis]|uniref:N-acetyltransferase domain-containing protein n=1 Tax=Tritonibacter horizontis TaxID=1768241 RepID=A0A132C3I8_9RHOB|nr:hypothetical protein [Tritonibacter horizontis]KUP94557.1 hypothetical protein TRIHO_04830 [Tritonibacter horizontis]